MNDINVPEEENITLNEFYQLFTSKPALFQGKDLAGLQSQLKRELDKQPINICQLATIISDWCEQYKMIATELTRIDMDQIPTPPPNFVVNNEIIENIILLLDQEIAKENTEPPTNQPADQQ